MPDIAGLDNIRTSQTTKVRSIPKGQKSNYLGLFMLNSEKDRLEKEKKVLQKRLERNNGRLKEIELEITVLKEDSTDARKTVERNVEIPASNAKIEGKEWKTLKFDY